MRILPLLLTTALLVFACSGRTIPTGVSPNDQPFDLTIPDNTPLGNYNAVSGVRIFDQMVIPPGDTAPKEMATVSYSAQLVAHPDAALPASVLLNDIMLEPHGADDTVRLASGGTGDLDGNNLWTLIDAGDTSSFVATPLSPIDTVKPFSESLEDKNIISGAQALTLRWPIPRTGSAGMRLIWDSQGTGYRYVHETGDGGSFTIPQSELEKLAGQGHVTMIRYRSEEHGYKEKVLIITRLAQREFDVNVIP